MSFFEKDNILAILLEDIFREPILKRIRIKDISRIFKDMNKDKEIYLGLGIFDCI